MIEYFARKETKMDKHIISEGEGVFLQLMTSEHTVVMRYDGTCVMIPTPIFSENFKMYRL